MKYTLLIVLIAFLNTVQAQLYCTNYDVNDGLASDHITAIAEDSEGYIYVGTSMGLSFFDGVNFITISDEGKGDIPYNVFVEKVRFDKIGNLWMSTEHSGLYRLEIKTNNWTKFALDTTTDDQSPTNAIWDIELLDKKILIANEKRGLTSIDIYTLEISESNKFQGLTITAIHNSNDGTILITTHEAIFRINSLDDASSIDTLYQSKINHGFTEAYTLSDNSTYAITYVKGVFEIKNGALIKLAQPADIDTWRYNFIDEYDGKQWITLRNYGLASIDIKSNKWQLYESEAYSKNTLPKGKYTTGFKDSRNILWIATTKGLSSINPELQAFININNTVPTNEFLLDAIYDKKRSQYVMLYASEKGKIKFFDQQFNNKASYNHQPKIKHITSLWSPIPYNGNYFCLGGEVMMIDGNTSVTSVAIFPGLKKIKKPRAITLDDESNLWILHDNDKIVKYSLEENKLLGEMSLPNLGKSSDFIYKIQSINNCKNYISIAAKDIFMMIDKKSLEISSYDVNKTNNSIDKVDKYPSHKGSITQVVEYDNSFYICSRDEGIYKAIMSQEPSNFTITSSLSQSDLYGPVELKMDDQNDIWIATDNGLALTDKDLKIKKKINAQDGLLQTKLSQGLSIANGNIILNSENGIVIADTSLLKIVNKVLSVDIKKILVNNEASDLSKGELTLSHMQNNIQINVSMPLYSGTNNYRYSYRLLPINSAWNKVNISQGLFRFDNLQPGSYTFEIKATIGQNEGNTNTYSFTIDPPYWRTWWFILLASLVLLSAITWAYKARIRNKVNSEKVKTKLAELQNEAIRAQLNPHFIFNALNSIRSLILMDKKEDSLTYLGRFSTLVREVLSSSKEDMITLTRELDFNENYVNIERLRFSQSLTYDVSIDKEINTDQIKVPPMIMQPFIENAIWHGLLGKESNAILKVIIHEKDGWLLIYIDDNGTGRKKKTVTDNTYKTKKAYGELLSRQRLQTIEAGAEIKILDKTENEKPSGTTVIIKLPLAYE